jgi:hypothetical protein
VELAKEKVLAMAPGKVLEKVLAKAQGLAQEKVLAMALVTEQAKTRSTLSQRFVGSQPDLLALSGREDK